MILINKIWKRYIKVVHEIISDITGLVTNFALNTKVAEIQSKILSTTILAKRTDYDAKITKN